MGLQLPRHFRRPVARDAAAAALYTRVLSALGQPHELLRSESLMRELLIALLARHGEAGPRTANVRDAGAGRMQRVRDYIDGHYSEDITVQTLAELAGLSRAHPTRAFARRFGEPLAQVAAPDARLRIRPALSPARR